ncbi:MAG: hypothetical protein EPN48_14145 [Microbacteriaceae bacterium]|nr:MAG: hypothetical protein EPN48_14145 [Microbacteriaceae bacterium]
MADDTLSTASGVAAPAPEPRGRVAAWLENLEPGYFALVMATGIVSIGLSVLGFALLGDILLICTAIGFVVLGCAYIARAVRFPHTVAASLRNPNAAVGYFTVVAGLDVLATGLIGHGLWPVALVLGIAAFVIWFALTYGLFSVIVLGGHHPRLREITGAWLVWVVGTQSIAVVAAALAPELPWPVGGQMLGVASILFWSVGVVLYLIFIVIIFARLILIETTPVEMGPAYWILMGATAISVRAAAGILALSDGSTANLVTGMRPFVIGLSVVLWSFGSWFIPLLVIFGLWRYFVRGYPWTYEARLWSVVFPLGMYAVASATFGRVIDFAFMPALASVWIWFAVAAWAIVVVLLIAAFVIGMRRPLPAAATP